MGLIYSMVLSIHACKRFKTGQREWPVSCARRASLPAFSVAGPTINLSVRLGGRSDDGEIVFYVGNAGCAPSGFSRNLAIVPRRHDTGEPNVPLLRAHFDRVRIKKP